MTCQVYQGLPSESVKAHDSGKLHSRRGRLLSMWMPATLVGFIQDGVLLQQYWAKEAGPYRFLPAAEMAEAFRNSAEGRAAAEELAQPPERTRQGGQCLPRSGTRLGEQVTVVLDMFRGCVPGQSQIGCCSSPHLTSMT